MQKKNKSSPKDNQNILVTILLALSVFKFFNCKHLIYIVFKIYY